MLQFFLSNSNLIVSWKRGLHGLWRGILGPPLACDSLHLSVEVGTLLTIEVGVTKERSSGASKRKHWQWYRNWYIHTNLSNIDILSKLSGSSTICGEYGSSVAVRVVVDQLDSLVQRLDGQADKSRAEDLFLVASHVGLDVVDDSRTNKVAIWILLNLDVTAVQENLSALLSTLINDIMNALLRVLANHWANVSAWLVTSVHLELLDFLDKVWDPILGVADKHSSGQSHAALSSSTEGSTDQLVQSVLLVGIRHNDTVVFGSHVGLNTLSVFRSSVINVLASLVRSNE